MALVRDKLSCGIYSYFIQWKNATDYHKTSANTKFKDKIYAAYRGNLLRNFLKWKDNTFKKKKKMKKMQIQQLTLEN